MSEILDTLMKKYEIPSEIFSSDELTLCIKELELLNPENRKMLGKIALKSIKCKEIFAKRFLLNIKSLNNFTKIPYKCQ